MNLVVFSRVNVFKVIDTLQQVKEPLESLCKAGSLWCEAFLTESQQEALAKNGILVYPA